jgi:hypothetical protein
MVVLIIFLAFVLSKANTLNGESMINWEEIDGIEKEVDYEKYVVNERRKIRTSVQNELDKFDKLACEDTVTEQDFPQDTQKTQKTGGYSYLQKALAQTLRWQSFCQTNT